MPFIHLTKPGKYKIKSGIYAGFTVTKEIDKNGRIIFVVESEKKDPTNTDSLICVEIHANYGQGRFPIDGCVVSYHYNSDVLMESDITRAITNLFRNCLFAEDTSSFSAAPVKYYVENFESLIDDFEFKAKIIERLSNEEIARLEKPLRAYYSSITAKHPEVVKTTELDEKSVKIDAEKIPERTI